MSSLLTAGDLISMQAVLNRTLPGTAIIKRNTSTDDGQGGRTDSYAAVGTTACRLSPLSSRHAGDEERLGDSIRPVEERIITLPASTDVTEADRIVVASVSYEVVALHAPRSWEISRRCTAVRV